MRIEKLEIDDLRSIKRLRWPEDGLGWGGRIPDVVVVAGANGSGKTTLLEEILKRFRLIIGWLNPHQESDSIIYKHSPFDVTTNVQAIKNKNTFKINTINDDGSIIDYLFDITYEEESSLIFFKSKRSNSQFSKLDLKKFENRHISSNNIYVWDDGSSINRSVEELCYSARWEDANAVLNGRPEKATKFKFYADEFEKFTEGEKRLVWTDEGELLVETRDRVRHDVNEMSSGEHQALIFSIMLSRWWAPGSIILIDEPELHLHTHWQAKLLQRIIDLQKERGGQAILATQSSDLFSMAPAGSQVLLGGW